MLQPVVVRANGSAAGSATYELIMGERRLRAAQAAGLTHHPGDHPGHRGLRPAARRAPGEPAPQPAQPARGGSRLPAAPRRLRVHARRARPAHPPVPAADLEHPAPAPPAAAGAAHGSPPGCCPPATPALCSAWRTAQRWNASRSGSSRRASRSAPPRRSSPWVATRRRRPDPPPAARWPQRGARRPRGSALGPLGHPRQGRTRPDQGAPDDRVRLRPGPESDPRRDLTGRTSRLFGRALTRPQPGADVRSEREDTRPAAGRRGRQPRQLTSGPGTSTASSSWWPSTPNSLTSSASSLTTVPSRRTPSRIRSGVG